MTDRIPFRYREFYDVPRLIDFQFGDEWFCLSSDFDEEIDDYPDFYDVYLLPFRSEEEFESNPHYWMDLSAAVHLGQIPVAGLGLDQTRRKSIDGQAFEKWLSARRDKPTDE